MATFLTGLWEASSGRVSKTEVQIFRTVNQLSDTVQGPVMVLMQAGSLGAVGVGAGLAYRLGFPRRAWAMASSGAGMWLACKGIKRRVGRGRPDRLLDQVIIRGRTQSGLGYPSGHSAVVAALATAAGTMAINVWLPRRLGIGLRRGFRAGVYRSASSARCHRWAWFGDVCWLVGQESLSDQVAASIV